MLIVCTHPPAKGPEQTHAANLWLRDVFQLAKISDDAVHCSKERKMKGKVPSDLYLALLGRG